MSNLNVISAVLGGLVGSESSMFRSIMRLASFLITVITVSELYLLVAFYK